MKKLVILFLLFSVFALWAQEVRTVDNSGTGDHNTIAEAVTYLNGLAEIPAGGITFNVSASQTFTDSIPAITAVGTEVNPIIFQKSGEGDNPVIFNNINESTSLFIEYAAFITFDSFRFADTDPVDDNRYETAIYVKDSDNINILNCQVEDFDKYGIYGRYATTNTLYQNNDVYYTTDYFTTQTSTYGIYVAYNADADNARIISNKVHGLKQASSTVYGIYLNQVTGEVINNMISLNYDNDKIYGLRITGKADRTMKIYNNTVRLDGGATDEGYAFTIFGGAGDVLVKNNIFINDRQDATQYSCYISFLQPGIVMDNNIYFSSFTSGFNGKLLTNSVTDLAIWQTDSGFDINSQVYDVEFTDEVTNDLHIAGVSLADHALIAEPMVEVTTDIDGETRNAEYPYIGADENLENPFLFELASNYVVDNTGNGDFISIAEAVATLNGGTIPAGGIIFDVLADQTFTDSIPAITAVGTEDNPVIFQKSGEGENPVISNNINESTSLFIEYAAYITFDSFRFADTDPVDENRYETAIYVKDSDNINILNCQVEDFDKYGIYGRYATTNTLYMNNDIYYTTDYYNTQSSAYGIYVAYSADAENADIISNKIYDLKQPSSTIYGIYNNQVTGDIINNFVSLNHENDKIYGIRVTGRADRTIKVLNNTVRLDGVATDEGYAFTIFGGAGDVLVKNNIFINDRQDATQYSCYISFLQPGIVMDNNIYFSSFTSGFNGKLLTNSVTDLAIWQTDSGFDMNSQVYDVQFLDEIANDLHAGGESLGDLALLAIPMEEVVYDIDGEERHLEYPYCGADENLEYPLLSLLNSNYVIDNSGAGDFVNFVDAIMELNAGLIPDGGVVFNVTASQTFTDSLPAITAVGTEVNPVIFQKYGDGVNPVIDYNFSEGTVLEMNGAAYITFEGIDVTDTNMDETYYERAYYVFASDHISILNCKISNFANNGIHVRDASTNTVIDNNEIFHTADYVTSEATGYPVYVQYNAAADAVQISNNKIYGLKDFSANAYGIRVWKVNAEIFNNFISLTEDNNDKAYGIRLDAGDPNLVMNVYFNTVVLAGAATDDGAAIFRTATDGTINLKNNILVNNRTGEFDQVAIDYSFVSGTWNSDYNVLYSANGNIGNWGDAGSATLEEWQTASASAANSVSILPEFVSGTDLHLAGISLGNYDLAGIPVADITTDIDGDLRHIVNPYMGADEDLTNPLNPENQFAITVDPLALDFGINYQNVNSDTLTFTIQNAGADQLTISSVVSSGNFQMLEEDSWVDTIPEFILAPAGSREVAVKFVSAEVAVYNDSIVVTSNAIENETVVISLTAETTQAAISTSETEIEFPETVINLDSPVQEFILYNNGVLPVLINEISTTANFTFKTGEAEFSNILTDITLTDSIMIEMIFNAAAEGDYAGELEIYSQLIHAEENGLIIALTASALQLSFPQITPFMDGVWQSESEFGDFDNDGDLDILTTGYALNAASSQIHIYRNMGNDTFEEVEQDMDGTGFGFVDWIDLDNDNDLDIVTAGQYQFDVYISRVYMNVDGIYSEVETNLPAIKGSDTDWVDFDFDGDLDMLIAGELYVPDGDEEYYAKLYLNQRDGNFEEVELGINELSDSNPKFADYDNDGDFDIAISGRYDSWDYRTELYRNDGDYNFTLIDLGVVGIRDGDLEWGDYDGDGDVDLFVTGSFDQAEPAPTHILRNDGNDVFTNVNEDAAVMGIRLGEIELADLDNDGDLDIMLNGVASETLWMGYMYLNQGNDTFTYADSLVALKYAEYSIGDYDNDLDSDIIMTGRYASEVYVSALFENEITAVNTAPEPPTAINATVDSTMVTLNWGMGSDLETADEALTYNLRIGSTPGGNDILTSMALDNGKLLTARLGNMRTTMAASVMGLPNGTFYASVQAIDVSYIGSAFCDEVSFEITESDVDGDNINIVPMVTELVGNYPNPFNPTSTIKFSLAKEQSVKLEIFNAKGQKVKTLVNDNLESGNHAVIWNGVDNNNKSVASGVYFYRLKTASYNDVKKMMLLK